MTHQHTLKGDFTGAFDKAKELAGKYPTQVPEDGASKVKEAVF
jgi:hypothetical protein